MVIKPTFQGHGLRNIGLLSIQMPDVAASPRIFYSMKLP
jgi:hypothetical protein